MYIYSTARIEHNYHEHYVFLILMTGIDYVCTFVKSRNYERRLFQLQWDIGLKSTLERSLA